MCSIGDDAFEDTENVKYMPTKSLQLFDKCNKCRENSPCVILRSKDKYCKTCFLAGTTHKFKALLGKHKLIRPGDRVLVIHQGGHASTALLHFIRAGLDLDTHKKLRFEPVVIFIEEQFYLGVENRRNLVENVRNETEYFKFETNFASLKQLIASRNVEDCVKDKTELLEIAESDKGALEMFLEKQSNETNKADFLKIIRRRYWVEIAKFLRCKFIFTPEISSDVASQILVDVSLGRGPHIPLDSGFCDDRDDEVKILRPLRLFDAKELAFYNYLNGLEPVIFKEEAPHKSIQNLMKKFVNNLQVNYPATVTTILKTGDKLSVDSQFRNRCSFCNAPFGEENSSLTSSESTQFSHWISTQHTAESFKTSSCDNYCFSCKKLNKTV